MNISFSNNQEAIQALKIIQEYLENNSNDDTNYTDIDPEKLFLELVSNLYYNNNTNNYDTIRGETIIYQRDHAKEVWFSRDFWLKFGNIFTINHENTENFLTNMIEKYFYLKGYRARTK